jgi:predicted ester cyclase
VTSDANIHAIRLLIEAWNSHDCGRIATFFHEDFENHQLPFAPIVGLPAYLEHCRHWFSAYRDFRIEVVTLFGELDLVCLESRGEGTRTGVFFGCEPSGTTEVNFALDVFEFRAGKVARERGYWDFSVATGRLAPMAGGHFHLRSPFLP